MQTRFTKDGIRFSLCATVRGLREPVVEPSGIPPQGVWANQEQKRKYTGGLLDEPSGRELTRRNRPKKGEIQIKPVPKAHFLESAPAD
jgi:hypothetical protein